MRMTTGSVLLQELTAPRRLTVRAPDARLQLREILCIIVKLYALSTA